jgi:hypothetical protein
MNDESATRVKRAWQLVLEQAEAQSICLHAAIRDVHVHADGDCLILVMPSEFARRVAKAVDNRELLTAIIARTTGDAPELLYVCRQSPPSPPRRVLTDSQAAALAACLHDLADAIREATSP